MDRLADLDRLRELRWFGSLPPGERDYWMLLAACALSWAIPPAAVRREVLAKGARALGGAWSERELGSRLACVLDRARRAARGETVTWRGVEVDPRYRYRTATIIELLKITLEEQASMRTLIGPEESARRYFAHQARRAALGGRARAKMAQTARTCIYGHLGNAQP